MMVYMLYNRDTSEQRRAEDLAERMRREQLEVELIDADSPRGIQLVENYDITGRPAVVLVGPGGSPLQVWQGADSLPTPSDVAYLAHQ
jgi:type II secretory pathway pseudopilin PulG